MFIDEKLNPVLGDILSEIEKKNLSDETRILLISDANLNVVFVSSNLDKWRKIASLNEIVTEPDLSSMIEIFSRNRIHSLNLEISVDWQNDEDIADYKVDITKIKISGGDYFLLVFESLNKRTKIERKINSLTYALDYGGIPVIITDENAEIIYSSSKFEEILNVEIEELYKAKLVDILAPYVTLGELDILKNSALKNYRPWKKTLIIERNNKTKYFEFILFPIFYEESGQQNFILTAHDITDFILKHQEIRRSEKWLHSIIDNITDMLAVFYFDEKNRCVLKISNRSFQKYIGLEELAGYGIFDLFEKREANVLLQKIAELKEKKYVSFDCTLNESEPIFETVGTVMFDPIDGKEYFIFVFKNISNRIAYERQLEIAFKEEMRLNKMKNDFLENMSHELRTPANAIVGYSEILEDAVNEKDFDTIKEIASGLKEVISRLIKLFNNIIDVAEAKATKVKIELGKVNLKQSLLNVKEAFESAAANKGLELLMDFYEEEIFVETDKDVLEKIFFAIIDNAIKYTDKGKVELKTRVDSNFAIVEIIDTGKGIDEKKLNELLIPFNHGEEGYTRNFQGAGLGLSLAYRLTLMLGGKLLIHSNKSGTNVTLKFPLWAKD